MEHRQRVDSECDACNSQADEGNRCAVRPYCLAYANLIRTMILSRFGTQQLGYDDISDDDFEIISLNSVPKM
nr:unnamed protein product [Callosobruchus analis]